MASRSIKCFMIEQTKRSNWYCRRFTYSSVNKCSKASYHNAMIFFEEGEFNKFPDKPKKDDPIWPIKCEHCEYKFTHDDRFQMFQIPIYRRIDNGIVMEKRKFESGAMWYADWYHQKGPDGHSLVVRTPGGDWFIDSRANNCTLLDDNDHRCWIRNGTPPNITVNKKGLTCNAGAGSISIGSYHGFLRNGYLED